MQGEYVGGQRQGWGARWHDDGTPHAHAIGTHPGPTGGGLAASAAHAGKAPPGVEALSAAVPAEGATANGAVAEKAERLLGGNGAAKAGRWAHGCPVNGAPPKAPTTGDGGTG